MLLTPSLLHLQLIITFFIGFVVPVLILTLTKYFNKDKDKSDVESTQITIGTQLSQNLWKEIGRLQEQINILQEREKRSEIREDELLEKILKLQTDNVKQTFQIEQLMKELNDIKKSEPL